MEFHTYTLPNGIKCIHREVRSKIAHCALMVNSGTRDEMNGEFGLAHFTEHALFKGTHKRKAYHINSLLENSGGELNAYTTKEETTVHATTLRGDLRKAVELIADVSFNSIYPEREIAREREVIVDEINTYKDSPADYIYDTFEDMLFDHSELGHNILGRKSDVMRYAAPDIEKFVGRTYTTDQMVFSSIGSFSNKAIESIALKYLGNFAATKRQYQRLVPPNSNPFYKEANKHTHQVHTIIGNRAYSITDRRRLALALLVNILAGPSANSVLNTVLREKNGLSYNIEASYSPYIDSGIFSLYFSADASNHSRCMELIEEQMMRLSSDVLSPRKFSQAKKQFTAQLAISTESNESYMLGAGKSLLVHGEVDTMQQVYDKIDALRATELLNVAQDIFSNKSTLIYK